MTAYTNVSLSLGFLESHVSTVSFGARCGHMHEVYQWRPARLGETCTPYRGYVFSLPLKI